MLDATPILKLYAWHRRRQLAREDAATAQERALLGLVGRARDTRFGRDHDFGAVRSVRDFQARVPLRRYEDLWRDYWQPAYPEVADRTWPGVVPYFALTSGTTSGKSKLIPCTREMIKANERATADLLAHHICNRPRSRLLAGRSFMLCGSVGLEPAAPGVQTGDLSRIAAAVMPWWARLRHFPPEDLEAIEDWEAKVAALAAHALEADLRTINGTPSWLLMFFDKLAEITGSTNGRLADWFPDLEMVAHGAVDFTHYRPAFRALLEGSHAETREVYAASEGFIAVADRGDGEGMRLVADNGLFYEFVPLEELDAPNPTRHWLRDAELGVNYALVLSSNAGLWAYVLGDTVRLVERAPPRLLITGRTSYMLSAFGEHLIAEEIEQCLSGAAEAVGVRIVDYSVGALMPEGPGDLGQHLFIVEFTEAVPDAERVAALERDLDARLIATNEDYGAYRQAGHVLRPPRVQAVPPGHFAAWMARRGKAGGQHKVPRVINDAALLQDLRDFVDTP